MNRGRLLVIILVLAGGAVAVLGRSAQVSVLDHERWSAEALDQQEKMIEIQKPRGRILSSDGTILATSTRRWALQVDQKHLKFPDLFAAAAAPLLDESAEAVDTKLLRGPRYLWLAKGLSLETAKAVQALERDAICRVPHWERVYPLGKTAAPVVGFVGQEELRLEGRAGLESYYEHLLTGESDRCYFVKDAHGRNLQQERIQRGRPGYDLELTLDVRLQYAAERELLQAIDANGAERGSVVVLDAHTGNLLALASAPFSDRPSSGVPYRSECWKLHPVQSAIEPGSTIKPFIAAAGLAAGVVRPGEVFDCTHRGIRIGRTWIRDHAEPDHYTLEEVIVHSSNTGIIQVAERLERPFLYEVLSGLGFGRRPDLGFPSEASGQLWSVDHWSTLSPSGLAMGQEMTASPLQLALAYASIANGGWLPEPRLVDRMRGRLDSARDRVQHRKWIMDRRLAEQVTGMLEKVVLRGTGTQAHVAGFRAAGKTGTAQVAVGGAFDNEHHTAWFAGFLPLPDPRWVIVVAIENPSDGYWASTVAAPVFSRIATATIHLTHQAPTESVPATPEPTT